MKQPRMWKKLERHPKSKEYPDLSPAARERMRDNLKTHGIILNRQVTLCDGMVIDGWQMYQGCIEENIKPKFGPLPKGMTPDEFVEIVNDTRRHETQETAIARAVARRERVVAARQEGQSIRTIAEAEEVSVGTIHHDLEASTVQGEQLAPDGKVTGQDGRTRKATRTPPVLCSRCARVGPIKGCEACKELRKKPRDAGGPTTRQTSTNGKAVYEWKAQFYQPYQQMVRAIESYGKAFKCTNTPALEGLHRMLVEVLTGIKNLHKDLTKQKAPEF